MLILVDKSHILITESIDNVTSFLLSCVSLISTIPVISLSVNVTTGYFLNGLNLLSLYYYDILPYVDWIIKTTYYKLLTWRWNWDYCVIENYWLLFT